jgi:tRNA(fMet)-specific endonuclease VapC
MSAITYGELLCLAKQSDNQKKARLVLSELLFLIPPLAVTKAVNEYYGHLCAYLENQDKSIKNNMLWVVAHALALDATLITHRLKNDVEIPRLKIENWISTVNN